MSTRIHFTRSRKAGRSPRWPVSEGHWMVRRSLTGDDDPAMFRLLRDTRASQAPRPHARGPVFRAFDASIYADGGRAPADYFLDFTRWSEVAVNALTLFAQVIYAGMITYRTWVVWNCDWRAVALPLLALLALMAGCIGLVYEETHVSSVFAEDAKRWITADAILTVCINIYGTGMIAYRIWAATWNTKRMGPGARSGTLQRVLGVFIESAALYTCWTLFFILTYQPAPLDAPLPGQQLLAAGVGDRVHAHHRPHRPRLGARGPRGVQPRRVRRVHLGHCYCW
ncbi:hypothetical protein C8Q80DRAFT_677772 [Daedaleopsis nitida]|nr:hypothetical protein C8Q80DRAFT_677772 [Daedaleopsis nitida]